MASKVLKKIYTARRSPMSCSRTGRIWTDIAAATATKVQQKFIRVPRGIHPIPKVRLLGYSTCLGQHPATYGPCEYSVILLPPAVSPYHHTQNAVGLLRRGSPVLSCFPAPATASTSYPPAWDDSEGAGILSHHKVRVYGACRRQPWDEYHHPQVPRPACENTSTSTE